MKIVEAINIGLRVLQAALKGGRKGRTKQDSLYQGLRNLLIELEAQDPEIATRNDYAFGLKHVEDALMIGYKWSEIPTLPAGLKDYSDPSTPR
jgi:hypothetical protein